MLVLILTICVTVLDQLSKYAIAANLPHRDHITLIPGLFDLWHVHNTGAAWGMLDGRNQWLVGFSLLVLVCLVVFRRAIVGNVTAHRVAMGLILAGVLGNLFDRIRFGFVVDFLDFHWRGHHFPTFNVADSSICVGVAVYLVTSFLLSSRPTQQPASGVVPPPVDTLKAAPHDG